MSHSESGTRSADWTSLLADPDLAPNLGKLLQIYREAIPERREQALMAAMRDIKLAAGASSASKKEAEQPPALPTATSTIPPFEPNIFSTNWAQDRRRHPRVRCFVAVELRVNESATPVWGNLCDTGLGGCQVETVAQIGGGSKVEIGLWVANGKIWVKGIALNGVVIGNTRNAGVRVRFEGMNASDKENLRQFLKYVQQTTRAAKSEKSYLELLK